MKAKVLFSAIGAVIGGPIGAAAGLTLGHAIDSEESKDRRKAQWLFSENGVLAVQCPCCIQIFKLTNTYWQCSCGAYLEYKLQDEFKAIIQKQDVFNETMASGYLVYLMGCMAGVDGTFSEAEKRFVSFVADEIGLKPENTEKNVAAFTEGFKSKEYEFAAKTLGNLFYYQPDIRHGIALALLRFSCIEGYYREVELAMAIRSAHFGLGISEAEVKNMLTRVENEMNGREAREIKKTG